MARHPAQHNGRFRVSRPLAGRLIAWIGCLGLLAGFGPANAGQSRNGPATDCAPDGALEFICGITASEDLARVPQSKWLIASGMNVGSPAHLYLIDSRHKRAAVAFPLARNAEPAPRSAMGCSGPPDLRRMSLDGLALRAGQHGLDILYAANHGDRMAIEVFRVDARAAQPRLQWIDCAPLPEKILPNAVAALPGGDFLAISFYDPTDPEAWSRMARGEATGRILRWHAGQGFAPLPDSATSGGNGLEISADGSDVYASAWSGRRLVVRSLRDGSRREIPLDFMPDNIHRQPDGSLLVGGQRTTVAAIHACTGPQCPQPWVVARVDPRNGSVRVLLEGPGNAEVNYACGAIAVGNTLYLTLRGDRRIAYQSIPGAALRN